MNDKQLDLDGTNINNINNINYKKTTLTVSADHSLANNSSSVNTAQRSLRDLEDQRCGITQFKFKSVKVDLFDNQSEAYKDKRKFKIALNIITKTGAKKKYIASMNGPRKNYKRNVIDQDSTHYKLVNQLYDRFEGLAGLRISKFYRSNPKTSMQDMSAVMYQTVTGYRIYVIINEEYIDCDLTPQKGLTPAQKKSNLIATWYKTDGNRYQPDYCAKEFE